MYFWLRLDVGLIWSGVGLAVAVQLITLTGVEAFGPLLVVLWVLGFIAVVIGLFVGIKLTTLSTAVADLTPLIGTRRAFLSKGAMVYGLAAQVVFLSVYLFGSIFSRTIHVWTRSTTPRDVHFQHLFLAWFMSAFALGNLAPAAFLVVARLRMNLAAPQKQRKKRVKRSPELRRVERTERYGRAVRSRHEPLD